MTVGCRVAYACLLVVSIAVAIRLMHRRQRRLDLMRSQRILIGGAAFIGSMIGAKIPFLADRGWGAFYDGTVWFADGKTILGGIVGGYVAVELAKWIANIRTRTGDTFALPVAAVDANWFDSKHSTPVLTQAITLCSLAATGVVLGQTDDDLGYGFQCTLRHLRFVNSSHCNWTSR